MNISCNLPPKFNTLNSHYNNKQRSNNSKYQQNFTGVNISKAYDTFCEGVGKHLCSHIFDNVVIDKIGYYLRNSENAVKHFLAVGSIITSGMYMHQTYTNKKMDKDRRETLTVNQGFTLLLSTLGAYTLDGYIKSWWKGLHEKYLRLNAAGNSAWDGMNEMNANSNRDITAKVLSGELKPDIKIKDDKELIKLIRKYVNSDIKFNSEDELGIFAKKLADIGIKTDNPDDKKGLIKKCSEAIKNGNANLKDKITNAVKTEGLVRKSFLEINEYLDKFGEQHVVDKDTLKKLKIRSKGFSALRSILVFGFVYRFFVPLAVVKPTNLLCDKYIEYKKSKAAVNNQVA